MNDTTIKIEINGVQCWITKDDLDAGEGAIMPTPDHVIESFGGILEDSYAHLFSDGRIMRYGRQIAKREDVVIKG